MREVITRRVRVILQWRRESEKFSIDAIKWLIVICGTKSGCFAIERE